MVAFGWLVLTLVFVDELLVVAAFGVWGWGASPRWLLVWLLPCAGSTGGAGGLLGVGGDEVRWVRIVVMEDG